MPLSNRDLPCLIDALINLLIELMIDMCTLNNTLIDTYPDCSDNGQVSTD